MNRLGLCLAALASGLVASVAHAQAPSTIPGEPEIPPNIPMFTGTHVGAYAGFEEMPGLLLGLNHNAWVLAGGATFKYDGNGIPDDEGRATTDHFSSVATLSVAYLLHNTFPVGIGPSLAYSADLAPSAFTQHTIRASVVFYFSPFKAPIVLVTVLSSRIAFEQGRDPVFELVTPSALIGYLIY